MPWVDANGEVAGEVCPSCEGYSQVERDLRNYRSKVTRLENEAERNAVAKRDGATWKAILEYWSEAFPDKRISSRGIKSARATKFFQRLEAGATPEDVQFAIDAAKAWPYVVYGKRRQTGAASDAATDLQDIVSVGNDAQFDHLVELGVAMKEAVGW